MSSLYFINITIHVLAALFWLGGMFFMAVVGAPVLRGVESPAMRAALFRRLGERYRAAGWTAIGVLVVTGVLNVHFHGVLTWRVLGSGAFWATPFGHSLALKLGAVASMLLVQAIHDFWLGPLAGTLRAGTPEALRARRWAGRLARLNAVLGLVLVWAAVHLARGG